jgi:pimeloyl-ACP methyl ester carboxylesterase
MSTTHTLRLRGQTVSYTDQGAGPAVVLLHAGGSSGRQWAKVAARLESRFRVFAPDLWGFGGTAAWNGQERLSHDHHAELVMGVIEHLAVGKVHLVGHSYGGATAVRTALARPATVARLVLIEPILMRLLDNDVDRPLFREYAGMAQHFLAHADIGDLEAAWQGFLDYRNGRGTWVGLSEKARQRFYEQTPSTVVGFYSNLENYTSAAELGGIRVPTAVLWGEKTTPPDRRVAEIVANTIPGARLEVIEGAEHMSPLTHPDAVAAHIVAHIDAGALHSA